MRFKPNWSAYPALMCGMAMLLGCACALVPLPILLLPVALYFITLQRKHLLLAITLFLGMFGYTYWIYKPLEPEFRGTVELDVHTLSKIDSFTGPRFRMRGTLHHSRALVIATLDQKLKVGATYRVEGELKQASPVAYSLSVARNAPWELVAENRGLAEWRLHAKESILTHLRNAMVYPRAADLACGLVTGEFSDRQVTAALGRFGLQHLLAISGFHFSLLAGILSLLLTALLPRTVAFILLGSALTLYLIFLGAGPSVTRAYISAMAVTVGHLVGRRCSGLNALGLGLCALLLYDPLVTFSVGFQLSFLATAGILLFYAPINELCTGLLPKRPLTQISDMRSMDQHKLLVLAFLRGSFSLGVAVNLTTLPLVLFTFHQFPWMSLLFNLFFPLLISGSMLLVVIGLFLDPIVAPVSSWIHFANGAYTHTLVELTLNVPTRFDWVWYVDSLTATHVIIYLTICLFIGLFINKTRQDFNLSYL